jgi:predicted metal-binding membrane protein
LTESNLEAALRRDRLIVAGSLGLLIALSWAYVLWLATDTDMGGMDMTGFRMIPAGIGIMAPANAPWKVIEFVFVFAMWAVMMIGMMAPSAAPIILIHARVGRQAKADGKPLGSTGWFAAGYFLTWIGFSLAATLGQWAIERAALLDSQMVSTSNFFAGIVLTAAGVYQWTPIKDACLAQCQSPLQFLMSHGGCRSDWAGCLLLGLRHGMYCVGCCWVLMALLFVGGVMNVLWIAVLALLVLFEKLTPVGRWIARAAGVACMAAGAWVLLTSAHQ